MYKRVKKNEQNDLTNSAEWTILILPYATSMKVSKKVQNDIANGAK